ncbi:type IV pilin N-terminal domain-containing protein [Methanolacinia petrolearia]|uniref:type IV pilin N-terminal domain-containing protein n=1 Tax=Methanolacinia petrolearia TaxID=54120 RepID=UPI003BACA0BE
MKKGIVVEKYGAVSPVVGVMLMLVVTIILAAVVSAFASGVTGDTQVAPQASLRISTSGDIASGEYDISIEHLSGDPIPTKDVEIIAWLTLPNGTVVKHVQAADSPYALLSTSSIAGHPSYSRVPHGYDQQKYGYPCKSTENVTLLNTYIIGGINETGDSPAWFGVVTWMPGDIARTYMAYGAAELLGLVPEGEEFPGDASTYDAAVETLEDCISSNAQLEVEILHVPSGKYILDETVALQG